MFKNRCTDFMDVDVSLSKCLNEYTHKEDQQMGENPMSVCVLGLEKWQFC